MKFKFSKLTKATTFFNDDDTPLCENMNFFSSESFKMLRTKITLSIPEKADNKGKVIGITSSVKGEGKSTTSINISYTLAEAGYKVCLIEADMRLPTIGRRLALNTKKGLTNLLVGQCDYKEALTKYTADGKDVSFWILTAGDPSPLPSELLLSDNMKKTIDVFTESFDYIIVDLPPVTVVNDALTISSLTDGMLLIARENYVEKASVNEALAHFNFAKTRIIGIVLTSASAESGDSKYTKYGRKYKYYRSTETE